MHPVNARSVHVQSVIDLRETKHSSVLENQEAKQTQRLLGFLSKVLDVVLLHDCTNIPSICLRALAKFALKCSCLGALSPSLHKRQALSLSPANDAHSGCATRAVAIQSKYTMVRHVLLPCGIAAQAGCTFSTTNLAAMHMPSDTSQSECTGSRTVVLPSNML